MGSGYIPAYPLSVWGHFAGHLLGLVVIPQLAPLRLVFVGWIFGYLDDIWWLGWLLGCLVEQETVDIF